ncbi:tyrosine recombinase [Emticicia aquatilis]|uniref:Tyrosine recombinase n=1 Tax=Emticicia aquatilis TaxID=1537369 RepID=A0A916YTS1_9BACT|nr:site-specific integrase [Emticicia aquatilis]GGD60733.1 tyrosine recombinase [Emticicia aquatilis]
METQSTKYRVKIVSKVTSTNRERLYLLYKLNKRTWEATDEFLFITPKGVLEKQHNKEVKIKVEALRVEREKQLFSNEIDEILEQKKTKNQDFYTYFDNYLKDYTQKDKRVMVAVYQQFKEFAPPPISINQIDENLCIKFKNYLDKKLNGETPHTYFARFKKFITYSSKGKNRIFKQNPTEDVKNTKQEKSIEKEVLNIDELKLLTVSYCGNENVKNAFLFACNTGLRFVDIKALKWKYIKGDSLQMNQAKTDITVNLFLNANAKKFLPERKKDDDFVFNLPSHNATIKNLENWAKTAGVDKHITFHCARHTFGTLLAFYGSDIVTVSKLMGHTSLKHTMKYIRIADEMKKKAVNAIPNY